MTREIPINAIISGDAAGKALISDSGLSFWGGVEAGTGNVIDVRHDLCGKCLKNRILFIPEIKGSCSSSGIILEMIRIRSAPAAIVTQYADAILVGGSIIGKELYERYIPIYTADKDIAAHLTNEIDVVLQNDILYIATGGHK